MSSTRDKDRPQAATPPVEPAGPPATEPLDAQDLFGELVDAPLPAREDAPTRKEPVRIRVSEPPPPPGTLPPEMAKLLDVLGPEDATPPAPAEARELLEKLPEAGPRPSELDVDALFDKAENPPPAGDDLPEEIRLLDAHEERRSKTGPKFLVAEAPREEADKGLDLAAVAERAFSSASAAPSATGAAAAWRSDVYGPYRLLDRVAVGGMAEVFKAKRGGVEGFEKIVAVKRILPHLSENQEFVDMFVNEAKMVAGLTHPNIVQIHDLGKLEKSYYIAMEYVHGRDLRTILRRAREKSLRMPLDLSLRIVSQVCAALDYAHRKRDERGRRLEIVHRDVSPQNILISFDGNVKLADFGIAKAATKAHTTDRGALRGKLMYMSPEQAWGRPIDRRSDIFSLGLVLYEMITDARPFTSGPASKSEMGLLEAVRRCQIAPPRSLNPRIPEALERIVMKALEADPDQRYQDAGEWGRALERFLREQPPLSANELARFMELLFDREEREEAVAEDLTPSGRTPRPIQTDLEAHPADAPAAGADAADGVGADRISIDTFLKRFGVK
jgi:serine/threonine protein kinase